MEFAHRAGHGMDRIWLSVEFATASTPRSMLTPPADTDRGLWPVADHMVGGVARDLGAEHAVRAPAPGCASPVEDAQRGGQQSCQSRVITRTPKRSPSSGTRSSTPWNRRL
ncbi:hypothetical protein ACE1SV_65130 [Streptomyces sennicomposti]